jgi:protein disulfide-isomerase
LCCLFVTAVQGDNIRWLDDYEQAINESKSTSKPILLLFTGTGWCAYCDKLEEEVLNTPDFARAVGNKFIFVKVNYPTPDNLPAKLAAQHKQLQEKYDIRGFPSVILIDSQQKKIGSTGYRSGGGQAYAQHLQKIVQDYNNYQGSVQNVEKQPQSGAFLKQLYEKSKDLNLDNDTNLIVRLGLQSDEKLFFMMERYRFIAEEGMIHEKEAQTIRRQLMESDQDNINHTHYQLAIVDFEAYSEEMDKEHYSADIAVAPLVDYIYKFGKQDPENLWKIHMIISQVYLDQNELEKALVHAQHSQKASPPTAEQDIAAAVKGIEQMIAR